MTCGVAIDVPQNRSYPPGTVDSTHAGFGAAGPVADGRAAVFGSPPGAVTSITPSP